LHETFPPGGDVFKGLEAEIDISINGT